MRRCARVGGTSPALRGRWRAQRDGGGAGRAPSAMLRMVPLPRRRGGGPQDAISLATDTPPSQSDQLDVDQRALAEALLELAPQYAAGSVAQGLVVAPHRHRHRLDRRDD